MPLLGARGGSEAEGDRHSQGQRGAAGVSPQAQQSRVHCAC